MNRNRWSAVGTVLLPILWFSAANAAIPSRVVLLRAITEDALTEQGNILLAAELRTAGFEVTLVTQDPAHDIRRDIETASAKLTPVAIFVIQPAPGGATVDLWLEDKAAGKLVIRRIVVDRSREAAADLAVRAIELLRGSLVILARPTAGPGLSPPADAGRDLSARVPRRPRYFSSGPGIAGGAAGLVGAGLGSTFSPSVRLCLGNDRGLFGGLTLAALGQGHQVRRPEGLADVHQDLLLIEGGRAFRPEKRLQPFVLMGAGGRRLRVDGTGTSSLFSDAGGTGYALVLKAGGGLAVRIASRMALVFDAGMLFMTPSTRIVIASTNAGNAGGFGLLGTMTAVVTF